MIFHFYDAIFQSNRFGTYTLIEANILWHVSKVKSMLNLANIYRKRLLQILSLPSKMDIIDCVL